MLVAHDSTGVNDLRQLLGIIFFAYNNYSVWLSEHARVRIEGESDFCVIFKYCELPFGTPLPSTRKVFGFSFASIFTRLVI